MDISIVSPIYKADSIIDELVSRIQKSVSSFTNSFEIILVDDGSPDSSWLNIQENCKRDKNIKGIKLSRNFGQHYAITAGLEKAIGDYVVVIDCDLQTDPKYIYDMYQKALNGNDIIYTKITSKSHSLFKNIVSKLFSFLFNYLSDSNFYYSNNSTFTLLSRKAVNAFCSVRDSHRMYLLVLHWLGFKSDYVEILHSKRLSGKSSYTIFKLCELAIDGIISQSTKLLRVSIVIGFVLSFIALLVLILILFMYFMHGLMQGWTSIICLILLSTGIVLISNGILGLYLGKTFEQAKNRPLYLIDELANF